MAHRHYQYKLGAEIPIGCEIGGGLTLGHANGIVINRSAIIGEDCTIMSGAVIGSVRGSGGGVPIIGNRVVISTGAKVICNINIGDDVIIGAGAIIVKDVPSGGVVVGNPGRVVNMNGKTHVKNYIVNYK